MNKSPRHLKRSGDVRALVAEMWKRVRDLSLDLRPAMVE